MRDVQAEQYEGRAAHALQRHRLAQERYTQKRGKGRAQRTEKPCALAAEVSLGDGLEGEADAGADYCKRKSRPREDAEFQI